jgi:hypothetical protein
MEFTMSRVVLITCGVMILLSITGVLDGIYDSDRAEMDTVMVNRLAYMMDVFESSGNDSIVLDGSLILPEGYRMNVHDGMVELSFGDDTYLSETDYKGRFDLGWDETKKVTRRTSPRSS